jgi:ABC-2 type transport system ATP-binding protein
MAKLQSTPETNLKATIEEAVEICGLGDRLKDKAKTYSKGMKRRLLVART